MDADFEANFSFFEPTPPPCYKPLAFYITPSPACLEQYNEALLSQLLEKELPSSTDTGTELLSSVQDKDMRLPPLGLYPSKEGIFEAI